LFDLDLDFDLELALVVVLLVGVAAVILLGRPLVVGDGIAYLIWLDSIAMDGDLDLENQAEKFAHVNTYHIYRNEQSGRWASAFPLGVAVLLTPFYWIGALLDKLPVLRVNDAHFLGIQGVPLAYSMSILLGVSSYTLAMTVLGYRIARRFASPWLSALATISVYLGTPLLFYTTVEPLNSHVAGAFSATLFIYLWLRARAAHRRAPPRKTWRNALPWLWVGLAAGLAALSRWQVALMAIPVGFELLFSGRWRRVLLLCAGFALLAWLIPYSWWQMFGSPWVVPAAARDGSAFLLAPVHTWKVLTSPIAGLFPWSPVTLLALVGLGPAFGRDWRLGLATVVMFVLQALISGMVRDWWAGSGFGMRRMAELYPVYVLLLGALLEYVALHERALSVLVQVLALAGAVYGVALLLAHLNFVWTNPDGKARAEVFDALRYGFGRDHLRLMWPVVKDHVGIWAWKKPGP
jgi:hypothetical protein